MVEQNIKNILIVSLNKTFCKSVAQILSDKLDMFYADCQSMIEYELINPKSVLNKCGIEYFKKKESGVIKNCSNYENTVLSIDYDLFKEYYEYFKSSVIIYICLPLEKLSISIDKIAYDKRNEFLSQFSSATVCQEKKAKIQTVENIMDILGEIL